MVEKRNAPYGATEPAIPRVHSLTDGKTKRNHRNVKLHHFLPVHTGWAAMPKMAMCQAVGIATHRVADPMFDKNSEAKCRIQNSE